MGLNFTFKNVDTISGRANGNHMSTELLENFFNEAHSESGELTIYHQDSKSTSTINYNTKDTSYCTSF